MSSNIYKFFKRIMNWFINFSDFKKIITVLGVFILSFLLVLLDFMIVFAFLNLIFLGVISLYFVHYYYLKDRPVKTVFIFIWHMINIIMMFGLIYHELGIINRNGNIVKETFTAYYFSIVTWTTLGYGDLQPLGFSKYIAGLEAFMGYVYMGILVALIFSIVSRSIKLREKGD